MKATKIPVLYVISVLLVLSGCWDQRELEKNAYVVALGIDKAKEEGKIKITYLISNPTYASQQQGGGSDEPPVETISFNASDFVSSRNMASAVIAKGISYDLLRTIVISEGLAKDKNLIRWLYDATKDTEIRRDIRLIVTKEETLEFFKTNKPKLETRPHEYFDLILERGVEKGVLPEALLMHYFRITEADADLFLAPYASIEKSGTSNQNQHEDEFIAGQFHFEGETNKTNFLGSAIFKEGKMIGTLTGEETRLSVMLNNTANASDLLTTYQDPFNEKYRITARLNKKEKTKTVVNLKKGTPTIDVTVPVEVNVLTNHSMTRYAESAEQREVLKKSIKDNLTKKIEKLVEKTQKEFKGQPFGWSLEARKEFMTIKEYNAYHWMERYPDMNVSINVAITFGEFGRQSKLPSLEDVRD